MAFVIDSAKFKILKHEGITFQNKFGDLSVHSQVASIYTVLDTDPFNFKRMSKDKIKTFMDTYKDFID